MGENTSPSVDSDAARVVRCKSWTPPTRDDDAARAPRLRGQYGGGQLAME